MQLARTSRSRARTRPAWLPLLRAVVGTVCAFGLIASGAPALEPAVATTAVAEMADPSDAPVHEQLFESVADGFRAWLPGRLREESSLRETIVGTVAEKKYFGEENGRSFSIGLHRLPKLGRFFAPTSLVLSTAKKNVLVTSEGRELSFERRDMDGHPGGVLTYEPLREDEAFEVMEVHLVLVGQRLYVLKASHPRQGADRASADRFFDSFEVLR